MKLDIDASHDPLLVVPPLNMPLRFRGWKGTLGYQRNLGWVDDTYNTLSAHGGVDLLTDRNGCAEPVYAATWGRIVNIGGSLAKGGFSVALFHKPYPGGLLTHYLHLQDVAVALGDEVRAGALLGHVKPDNVTPHLHFELRRVLTGGPSRYDTIDDSRPLDPTQLLYRFEVLGYPLEISQTESGEVRKETDFVRKANENYRAIERARVVQWNFNSWLFEVIREADPEEPDHDPKRADYYYLPVNLAFAHERQMIELLREAFDRGHRVKLNWRESYFFARWDQEGKFLPRKVIEGLRVRPA